MDDTIARIIRRLDPAPLNDIFLNFINEIRKVEERELIAIDGKTLRIRFGEIQNALHSITVLSKSRGLTLSLQKSAGEQNHRPPSAKTSMRGKLKSVGWSESYQEQLLFGVV